MINYKILSEIRIAKGYKAKEVARMLNISPNTLSGYETGVSEPSIDTIAKLADIYNVNIENIVIPNDNSVLLTEEEYENLKSYKKAFLLGIKCFKNIENEYFAD